MAEELLIWWRRPVLLDAEEDRRASWLELFIDLMFVAIISALAKGLAADVTLTGVAVFTLVFLPAWWIWTGLTIYNDRFETDDVSHRIAFFVVLVALGGMAVSARHFFLDGFWLYALSYVLARLVIIALWLRAGYHNPAARPLTTRYSIGFGAAATLWLLALAVPWPARLDIVLLAIAIDFATPLLTLSAQRELPRLSATHLPERFGLFVIIVLGEAVIGVEGTAALDFMHGSLLDAAVGPAALAVAFVLWWLYFDHVAENPPPASPLASMAWAYPHLLFALVLGMFGAAAQALVAEGRTHDAAALALACVSVGLSYATIALLEFATEPGAERQHPAASLSVHLGAGLGALLLAFVAGPMGALTVMLLLTALGVAQIAYGYATRAYHFEWDAEE